MSFPQGNVQDLGSHLRNEGLGLGSRLGWSGASRYRVILIHLALVGVFGVFVPWTKGIEFLDPVITAAYACLGILFAGPAAAQAFADRRPVSMTEALTRIGVAVLYGEFIAAAILLAGFMTVYTTRPHLMFAPDMTTLAEATVLGIAGSVALASLTAWITLRFSPGIARSALRTVFLLLLLVFFYEHRWLPDVTGVATLVSIAIGGASIFALQRQLQ